MSESLLRPWSAKRKLVGGVNKVWVESGLAWWVWSPRPGDPVDLRCSDCLCTESMLFESAPVDLRWVKSSSFDGGDFTERRLCSTMTVLRLVRECLERGDDEPGEWGDPLEGELRALIVCVCVCVLANHYLQKGCKSKSSTSTVAAAILKSDSVNTLVSKQPLS